MRFLLLTLFGTVAVSGQITLQNPQPGAEYSIPRDDRRDPWQKPDQVIAALTFSPTESVAVIESGYPYFAPRIARLVQKLYAINSDSRAFQPPIPLPPSVSPVTSTTLDPHISGMNLDTVMMVNTLQWLPQRAQFYLGIVAGLKPGGRLIIIDRKVPSVFPPALQITDTLLEAELPLAGFSLVQQFTFLQYQYFVVFRR